MHSETYRKALNPYLKTAEELESLARNSEPLIGGHFFQLVIPIKGQAWLTPGCPRVKHLLPYKDGAWALRVGYGGDDYAGHTGMAWCPFAAGETFKLVDRKDPGNTLSIRTGYIIPVQKDDGLWYYRVEYHGI